MLKGIHYIHDSINVQTPSASNSEHTKPKPEKKYSRFNNKTQHAQKGTQDMLEGKNVCLRLRDKEDLDFFWEFWNNIDYYGEYETIQPQITRSEAERRIENPSSTSGVEWTWFVIEKTDGKKIGFIIHFTGQPFGEVHIGYALIPSERNKGHGTEALQIMVDYLFLTKDIMRIQASTDVRNKASQKILEKVGFKKEGEIRKASFVRGQWVDEYVYGILREDWKEPKILTKKTQAK
jgi:RimJ/RimL family protein N-acetyltransferase